MTEMTFKECGERGYTFLSGVGNQNSTPIFVKKWGYQSICQLDVKLGMGPVPPSREMPDSNFVRVWDDPEGIAWRLSHAPAASYRVKWHGDVGHVYAETGRLGIQAELCAFPRAMLPDDMPELQSRNPLHLWIGKDPTRNWSKSLYFDIPHRLRPSPLHLLWHDLTGKNRRHQADKVQYMLFNFDAY